MSEITTLQGDCKEVLKTLLDQSVNLIVTSPPYANQRKKTYGGVHPDKYVEWFLPIAAELKRVLRTDGSFILNIKEHAENGERSTYVYELVIALKKQGWVWTEEYIWHKKTAMCGKWPNRFRDAWEHCYHFNKQKQFTMNQDAVMVPVGGWAISRLANLSQTDSQRMQSATGSGAAINKSNFVGRDYVYPSNVLHLPGETSNQNHSAVFPEELPEFFIKLFSNPYETVLDPFAGSGTTGRVAIKHNRNAILIELNPDYLSQIDKRTDGVQMHLAV